MISLCGRFRGLVYRGHDPQWAFSPESGEGARLFGGRFNQQGRPALYASLVQKTAWTEAQQGFPLKPQPLTIVTYEVDYDAVLDLSDPAIRKQVNIALETLACPWEWMLIQGDTPPTWTLAEDLIQRGITAILVPSFARASGPEDVNIVFWEWTREPPKQVKAIDDTGRLPRDRSAWR